MGIPAARAVAVDARRTSPIVRPAVWRADARWPVVRLAVASIASGLALFLGCPPWNLDWLVWVALVPGLYAAETADGPLSAFWCGVLAGLPFFCGVAHGLLPLYRGTFVVMWVAFSVVMGVVFLLHALSRPRALPALLAALVLPAIWVVVAEAVPGMASVPWSLSLSQTRHLALLQIASVVGWYGVSFVILLATAAVLEGVRSVAAGRADRALRAVALASGVVALSVGYGEWGLHHRIDGGRPLRVAVVQPVIAPEVYEYQAIDPAYRRFAKETVRRLSAQAAALRPDLLLWPEGGNGQVNFRIPALRHEIRALAHRSGATLLVSTHDLDANARLFNTVFAVSPRGRVLGRYAKTRLTPVAEREFTPGRSVEPLRTPHGRVGALLCWESLFSSIARRLVRNGAVLLFVSTSDASLRHSSLTFLHGRAAILRAIENRRPLVQASNAGPSFLVSAYGEVAGETPLDGRAVLVGDVTPAAGETPYTRFGDWPLLGAALAILAIATASSRRRGRRGPARRGRPTAPAATVGVFVAVAVGLVTAAASVVRIGMDVPAFHGSWSAALEGFARAPTIAFPDGAEFRQSRENTCGPAALAQMLSSLGVDVTETELLNSVPIHPDGASMGDLAAATRRLGLLAWGERQNLDALEQCPLPVIAHVRGNHYVVVQRFEPGGLVDVFDPAEGYVRIPVDAFRRLWDGYVLIARFARIPGWRDG